MAVKLAKEITFEQVKSNVIYSLRKKDEEVARLVPHMEYLDMMIEFEIYLPGSEPRTVTNEIAEMLGVDEVDLMIEAKRNTPRIMGLEIKSMFSAIAEYSGIGNECYEVEPIEETSMVIVTNRYKELGQVQSCMKDC